MVAPGTRTCAVNTLSVGTGSARGRGGRGRERAASGSRCASAKMGRNAVRNRSGAEVADNQSDLVILGGGSGGYAAALRAAELGKSVVLIEKDRVGGTCLHRGCIPTKALLHAGEIADGARESATFGVNATFEGIDMAGVHKYKDGVIGKNWKGLQGLIKSRGIQTVEGEGKLVGARTVQVQAQDGSTDTYTGTNLVL